MKNISLGRYIPTNSFLHRTDPRVKFFGLVLFIVLIFLKFNSEAMNFIMYGVFLVMIFTLIKLSKLKIMPIFKQLKTLWFMMLFLFIINVITLRDPSSNVLFTIFNYPIYEKAVFQTLYIFVRLVLMISLTTLLTATTKPLDLTYALEWYMYPLRLVKFPVHEIAMTISIALRFIPTLLDETGRIMRAQESRGVDFKGGRLKEKLYAIVSLIVPLFVSAMQRSDELANAMIARGYNPQAKRTRYRELKFGWRDLFVFVGSLVILTGIILIREFNVDFVAMFLGVINAL
ncbi:MAG TPA: energy-coupling factor transporter transmembrane component T [Bacilli bacterium]|nr:energy-coupling factor transporter transmembrane component T [Bacilli bacterium]